MTDLIEAAKSELASLEKQERDFFDRVTKRKEDLQRFLQTAVTLLPSASISVSPNDAGSTAPLGVTSHGTKQSTILSAVNEILSTKSPLTTRYLLAELNGLRIDVTGKDIKEQVINLSSLLSRNKETFRNDRALGWSLKKKNPAGVGALAGSVQASLPVL